MSLIALDVGGSHIAAAVVAGARVHARAELPVPDPRSWEALLHALEPMIASLIDEAPRPEGIAIAFPALIDRTGARVLSTPRDKYADAPAFDFPGWARARFGLPVRLELDARMALLGERHAGALRGAGDCAILTIGTGLGSAAIVDGRLLRGSRNQAGALGGHLSLSARGERCICGNVGCAEATASAWALSALAGSDPGFEWSRLAHGPVTFERLFALAEAGDSAAKRTRDRCIEVWAQTVLNVIHAYDVEAVALTGGVMAAAEVILPGVRAFVSAHAWLGGVPPRIEAGALGGDAALLGAEPLWTGAA